MRTARTRDRHLARTAAGLTILTLLTGCGSVAVSSRSSTKPSAAAEMICSAETADAVQGTYALTSPPTGSGSWSPSAREYTCRYPLAHSLLVLTVKDFDRPGAGDRYFQALRGRLSGSAIGGMENLGFPAFENAEGQVGFLKDGRTLLVDGSRVAHADLRAKSTRTESAYGVAAAVIACWKG